MMTPFYARCSFSALGAMSKFKLNSLKDLGHRVEWNPAGYTEIDIIQKNQCQRAR